MICPTCGSENVNAQMVSETDLKLKRKGVIYWIFIGWWWIPIKWVFLFFPALIMKIFAPKKYKTRTQHKSVWICQNCGNHWNA